MEEKIQNNNVQPNVQPTNTVQQADVQPITVPLQIKPIIAQPGNDVTQQNTLNNIPNVSTTQTTQQNIPTPQEYVKPVQQIQNANTNYVQNNNSNYQIKRVDTSNIDTSTPSGQYRSVYGDTINQIISELYNNRYFDYNPNEDLALQQAMDYSTKTTTSALASRGILNSSITAERIARVVSELTAQYRQLALSEWQTQMNMISNIAQLYMNMDEYEFAKWQDARDQQWKEKMQAYQEKQDEIKNAWNRVDALGYVDNKASTVLGVAVGTLSKDAREAKEAYQRQLEMMQRKAEIEYETEKKLAEVKTELEKDLIKYQSNYTTKSSTSNNNVSLNTYDSIIQNRWAEYDELTKKYNIDLRKNNEVYNFLMSEYNAGRLLQNDAASLIAKYGIQNPMDEATIERLEYLKQLTEK